MEHHTKKCATGTGIVWSRRALPVGILTTALLVLGSMLIRHPHDTGRASSPPCSPWESVGGCGASSGSAGGAAGLKWIGNGVDGPLLKIQVIVERSVATDTAYDTTEAFDGRMNLITSSFAPRLMFAPRFADFSLSVPFTVKQGYGMKTGFLGDISFEVAKSFGYTGGLTTALAFQFPSGRSEVEISPGRYAVAEMQLGTGVYGAQAMVDYTLTLDWGIITAGGSYTSGWLANVTDEYDYDTTLAKAVSVQKSLTISRDRWGAVNDLGTVHPDILGFHFDFGIKTNRITHGISIGHQVPLRRATFVEREKTVKNSFSTDSTDKHFFLDKNEAQRFAESARDTSDGVITSVYEKPTVVGVDSRGRWVVIEHKEINRIVPVGVNIQYSVERADTFFPILVGGSIGMVYDKGIRVESVSAGVGFQFGIY